MAEPIEHLRIIACYAVVAYRPHRTAKGHYVWRKHRVVAGPFHTLPAKGYENIGLSGIHNIKLTENETIKAIAQDEQT